MNPRTLGLLLFYAWTSLLQAQHPATPPDWQRTMQQDIDWLCADARKGRDTPSPELDSSAAYIRTRMTRLGLSLALADSVDPGFNVIRTRLGASNTLRVIASGKARSLKIKDDFVPHFLAETGQTQAPVVFAGYGITAPEYGYDDYAGVDVQGAVVWILTLEPQINDSLSVFNGLAKTQHAKVETKLANAKAHGATGVILMAGPLNNSFRRPPNSWPSLMRRPNMDALMLRTEDVLGESLPMVQIGRQGADALLQGLRTPIDLKAIQAGIDSTLAPHSFPLEGLDVSMRLDFIHDRTRIENVVGFLEGSDPVLKKEALVIGGHYDHLGMQGDSLIYRGADDNASGVAGVLALAQAFAMPQNRPKRSLLFCAWAGEEKGLFGATHFAQKAPLWPIEQITAYINMDMIGRLDSARVFVSGTETSPEWNRQVEEALNAEGLTFINEEKVSRSDHVPFYQRHISVLDFSTGFHPDYHKVTDTPDKINYPGMERLLRSIGVLIQDMANAEARPLFQEDPDSPLSKKPDTDESQ